jgi:hypothetical protein
MDVSYTIPLKRAWARARHILFQPFRLDVWATLGFSAFLSEYLGGDMGGGGNFQSHGKGPVGHVIHGAWRFLHGPLQLGLVAILIFLAFVVGVLLLWVSCRGKFIFLDNVAHHRTTIAEPWRRFKRQGDSLFVWYLGFWFLVIAAVILLSLPFLGTLALVWSESDFRLPALGALLVLGLVLLPVILAMIYVRILLHHFVVPLMHRYDLTATAAWGRFLPLLRREAGHFIAYGIFLMALWFAVMIACMTAGIATCCVGFVVLALPYVSSVVLLPVLVTFRAIGPEFLAQFGPEFAVLPALVPATGSDPAGTNPSSTAATSENPSPPQPGAS